MNIIKKLIRKMINYSCLTSDDFIKEMTRKGVKIGMGTFFFDPATTYLDTTRPFLLQIGEYVKITKGCIILVHDYACSVIRKSHGTIVGEAKETVIGDNVFIGMNSIILPGVHIGNNVIIGAGTVVTKDIPSDVVVGGNPCKILTSLDSYNNKKKLNNLENAKLFVKNYYQKYGKYPNCLTMEHFFPLFLDNINDVYREGFNFNWNGDNSDEIKESFIAMQHKYSSYEDFIQQEILNEI